MTAGLALTIGLAMTIAGTLVRDNTTGKLARHPTSGKLVRYLEKWPAAWKPADGVDVVWVGSIWAGDATFYGGTDHLDNVATDKYKYETGSPPTGGADPYFGIFVEKTGEDAWKIEFHVREFKQIESVWSTTDWYWVRFTRSSLFGTYSYSTHNLEVGSGGDDITSVKVEEP